MPLGHGWLAANVNLRRTLPPCSPQHVTLWVATRYAHLPLTLAVSSRKFTNLNRPMSNAIRCALPLVLLLAIASLSTARELKTVKFEVLPSSSVALTFQAKKVEWVLGKVRIEGAVRNEGPDDYEWVEVVYTALDRNRNVLGSDIWHVTPIKLGAGALGQVDGDLIFTKGRIPAFIEVEITGETP